MRFVETLIKLDGAVQRSHRCVGLMQHGKRNTQIKVRYRHGWRKVRSQVKAVNRVRGLPRGKARPAKIVMSVGEVVL